MDSLTISQLAQFSGIKAHTIRIWEQRYQALRPKRSEGNTRTYSGLDLKRLLNIVTLIDSGYKVSELCIMDDEVLSKLLRELYVLEVKENPHQFVPQLISAGMEFDEITFQRILKHCFSRFGVLKTYKDIIFPLLNRVGLLWSADLLPPAQEHFMFNLIRQKLLTAIDALPPAIEKSKKWILLLPEDEFHELGLLFAQYILKHKGEQVVYLGANVPLKTLKSTKEIVNPDCVLLFFVRNNFPDITSSYLASIMDCFKDATIYISGNQRLIGQLNLTEKVKWVKNIDDL